ncbi:beta-galactosidase [Wenyingzhuangia sp. IMCC45533]
MKYKLLGLMLLITIQYQIYSQDLVKEAESKIEILKDLIKEAEVKNIDVLKEKTTITTAETFLKYALWDENNKKINEELFSKVNIYKKTASKMAEALPRFERKDVIKILDNSIKELNAVVNGKEFRQKQVNVDWTEAKLDGDQISYKDSPVFLSDYTWKPNDETLNEYYGHQDGFYISPNYLDEEGMVKERVMETLMNKPTGTLGFIFFNHKKVPDWTEEKYGKGFLMREDTFTAYDIDHPGARKMQKNLLAEVVPYMAGKKYSELGYMLCNEPHFYTEKTGDKISWASGPVSKYTHQKFKIWLQEKHKNIGNLNSLWETTFTDFNEVTIEIPIDTSLRGTPIWYDWCLFNMERVTDWYQYLKHRIRKDDIDANVHLKIMPSLWTNNLRSHGIDLEALTNMSGIIGNDAGAEHIRIYGKPHRWEKSYIFDWREMCMGFDFMKSVSPNKITYNTESHYLSSVKSKDLYLNPMYARASFWLAHTYGTTASQIWYWPRNSDGSVSMERAGKHYAGSNNQQPAVTNEVAHTMIDLNANAKEIMAMQRQKKSIRLFYSKTSAINKEKHMDDVFDLYEKLNFNGVPLGFVTEDILKNQSKDQWSVVLVRKTPFVTKEEMNALQGYLNNGGTVVLDDVSLKFNEYGKANELTLTAGSGRIVKADTLETFETKAFAVLDLKDELPAISINETNVIGTKGCIWRVVRNKMNNYVLSVVNVGKSDASLNIKLKDSPMINCKDIITGVTKRATPVLKPYETYFVEVTQ